MQQSKLQQFLDSLDGVEQSYFIISVRAYCNLSKKEFDKLLHKDTKNRSLKQDINARAFYRYSRNVY